jgi:hypothetical protein
MIAPSGYANRPGHACFGAPAGSAAAEVVANGDAAAALGLTASTLLIICSDVHERVRA